MHGSRILVVYLYDRPDKEPQATIVSVSILDMSQINKSKSINKQINKINKHRYKYTYTYVYIYICIYKYTYIYIYIYI